MRAPLLAYLIALAGVTSSTAPDRTITLAWDPSPGATGYRIYWRNVADVVDHAIDVGNVTVFQIVIPDEGNYRFAVASYALENGINYQGESLPSSPVCTATCPGSSGPGTVLQGPSHVIIR